VDRAWQDVRYALRTLRRDFAFTALIVLILAIGIGLNTAVFSVVRAVLLAPLPYEDPARLTMLWTDIPEEGVRESPSAWGNVEAWKAQNHVFEDLATFDPTTLTLTGGVWPERISGVKASANLPSVLGVAPALGRWFSAEEERGDVAVAVLSHALWERRFAGSADAIGGIIEVAEVPFRVVGVMPAGFGFPDSDAALWLPQSAFGGWGALAGERGTGAWRVVGRMSRGTSLDQVGAEMDRIAARLEQEQPEANAGLRIRAVPLHDQMTGGSFRLALWTLFGAVEFVLLIACANGAHMILARGMNRAQEFALRVSLGANTPRLIRQLLTESLVLAGAAGVAGVLLAQAALRVLLAAAPAGIPRVQEIAVDPLVLGYALAVSLTVGVLFGVAPALGFRRAPLAAALREGRSPSRRGAGHRTRSVLSVFQFALAIMLVFGASVLVRSLIAVRRVDPGFRTENVLMTNLSVERSSERVAFYDRLVREVGALPGVAAAGIVEDLFISGAPNATVAIEGSVAEPASLPIRSDAIAGDFFASIGASLRAGREFAPSDGADAPSVAIVNETMARRFWPDASPIGKRFRFGSSAAEPWIEVVGVAGDMRRQGPENAPIAQIFRPYAQAPSRNMNVLIRTDATAPDLVPALRTRVAAMDRTVALPQVTTLEQAVDIRYVVQRRFQTLLLGLFSAIALMLAAVGVYGLMQYSVAQRQREIGVRMALGGTSGDVVSMVLRQGLAMAVQGLALGTVGALLLSDRLSALFFGAGASDFTNVAVTAGILLVTTVLACWLPARRAARIDPMVALRQW
jgi:predicted permease